MENYEVVDVEKLIYLERKLEKVADHLQESNLQQILDWARNDIVEIKKLNRLLTENHLLENDKYKTKELELSLSRERCFESNIMEIYSTLTIELQNWRELYLKLKSSKTETC